MILNNKKGMGVEQVFIFIVAAITFALVLIFGYNSITDFMNKGEKVEFYQFKSDLENGIKQIYTEYGSVKITEYSLPSKYTQICFVDLSSSYPTTCNFNTVGCNIWESANGKYDNADQNVFLKPAADVSLKVHYIDVGSEGYLCLNISSGKFKLRLEGLGDKTKLSPAPKG